MVRQIYDAKLESLLANTMLHKGLGIWYALSDKIDGKLFFTVNGPSRITEFREWNGKLQLKTADNDACWIYAKLCFLTRNLCSRWVTDVNNNKTLHGEIA